MSAKHTFSYNMFTFRYGILNNKELHILKEKHKNTHIFSNAVLNTMSSNRTPSGLSVHTKATAQWVAIQVFIFTCCEYYYLSTRFISQGLRLTYSLLYSHSVLQIRQWKTSLNDHFRKSAEYTCVIIAGKSGISL